MAVVGGGDGLEGVAGGDQLLALEGAAQHLDGIVGELGQIGQGAGFDLAVLAVAFAQQDSGRGVAVGDAGYVHAYA